MRDQEFFSWRKSVSRGEGSNTVTLESCTLMVGVRVVVQEAGGEQKK